MKNVFLNDNQINLIYSQEKDERIEELLKILDEYKDKPYSDIRILFKFKLRNLSDSPFLLSDVRKQDIILFKSDSNVFETIPNNINTFGANIHTMLSNSFFLFT